MQREIILFMDVAFILDRYFKGMENVSIDVFDAQTLNAVYQDVVNAMTSHFLYKTEINSLARVTKIKDMVKNGAYNYITNHNRPVYTSDTFLYEFYSDWVPSPAMPLVNL